MRISGRALSWALVVSAILLASLDTGEANPSIKNYLFPKLDKAPTHDQWRVLPTPPPPKREHKAAHKGSKADTELSPFDQKLDKAAMKLNAVDLALIDRILSDKQLGDARMPMQSDPERDESRDAEEVEEKPAAPGDPHYRLRFKAASFKNTSCADECDGEGYVVEQLKKNKPTPQCCVDLIYETVTYIHKLMTTNKLTYWTMKGTLLGVMREKGVVMHDYDIDLGMMVDDINKLAKLRQQIYDDGFLLLQAPWDRYNNMQFVIIKRTKAVKKYLEKNPIPEGGLPKFTKKLRDLAISGELMAFTEQKGQLIQVLCTSMGKNDPSQYEVKISPSIYEEFLKDEFDFKKRGKTVDGWAKYADMNDKPWADYQAKFGPDNVSPYCERTAPSSFRYEGAKTDVIPVKTSNYFDTFLNVPRRAKKYLVNYFGRDWHVRKRRYGADS